MRSLLLPEVVAGLIRLAAVADVHCHPETRGRLRAEFERVNDDADVLILAGDLTLYGRQHEIEALLDELRPVRVPVLAVLGNHDFESDQVPQITALLEAGGVTVLDGTTRILQIGGVAVGFAGVKGFAGGFGRRLIAPFGEPAMKAFVYEGLREAQKLERALRSLDTPHRVVVTHFSPIRETLEGESPELWPFLGSSALEKAVDEVGADVVFHGHAHYGTLAGRTAKGIPVFNVAHTIVKGIFIHELVPKVGVAVPRHSGSPAS